jgi:hypothetical protein
MAPEAGLGAIPAAPFGEDKGAALISGKSGIPAGQESFTPAARELPGWASLLAAGFCLSGESPGSQPALRRSARASRLEVLCVTRAAMVGAADK